MKRYDTYKDSGVQWLGEIPSHWAVLPTKRLCHMKSGNNLTSLDIKDEGPFKVYGANGFRGYYNQFNVTGPHILVGRQGALAGNVHFVDGNYWATDHALITTVTLGHIRYVFYALLAMNLNQYAFETAAQPGLAASKILSLNTVLPPRKEQEAIVAFLDEKTGEIDGLVSQVEHEIELLKEYKQAEIARVVTKGLNPDAPMRPSGISWIGDIPAHWEVRKLFQVVTSYYESNKGLKNTNLLSLSYGSIIQKDINKTDGLLPASFETYQIIKPNIIVLRLTDLQNDHKSLRVGISKYEGIITSAYEALKVREPNDADYIYYQLHVNDIHKVFYGMGGGLRQNLNYDGMRYMLIVAPPVSEQKEIVEYINYKTTEIDRLVVELTNQVEYLKEYKQRLIADVVTGKINVQTN